MKTTPPAKRSSAKTQLVTNRVQAAKLHAESTAQLAGQAKARHKKAREDHKLSKKTAKKARRALKAALKALKKSGTKG